MKHLSLCKWTEKTKYNTNTYLKLFCPNFSSIRKIGNSILFTIILLGSTQVCWGQDAVGDFQSKVTTGNWGVYTSWKRCSVAGNPGTFIDAKSGEVPTSTTNVTILSGNTITLTAAGNAQNLTIDGTLSAASYILTISGNFTNNGTFTPGTSTVNMKGSDSLPQKISGSGILSFCNLTISTATVSPNTVTIADIDVMISKNLTINASCTLSWSGAKTLTVNGNFSNSGTFNPSTGTVNMSGSAFNQSILGSSETTFYNLMISNTSTTGTSSLKDLSIANYMTINSNSFFNLGSSVVINRNSTEPLIGTLLCNGVLKVTSTDGYLSQYKFNKYTIATVEYSGSAQQTISPISDYNVLRINNAKGCQLSGGASIKSLEFLIGDFLITANGSASCTDLKISAGVLTVDPGGRLSVTGSTTLGSPSCLVLRSDGNQSGSFVFENDGFSGTGTVRVERYMSLSEQWHLYSSPIKDQSIHDFLKTNLEIPDLVDESNTVIGVGMRDYNTTGDVWNSYYNYNDPLADIMGSGKGFSIRTTYDGSSTGTVIANGIPNPNTVDVILNSSGNRWNCIGNPFTCALNSKIFLSTNSALLDESYSFVYLWDGSVEAYFPQSGSVQTGQGFFVKSKSAGGTSIFSKAMQSVNTGTPFKSEIIEGPLINIVAQSLTSKSTTKIKFIANTTKGLDPGYDAGMLKANPNFALYSKLLVDNGVDFCIQCLPDQNYDQYVIPIGLDCKVAGDITFTAETVNLPSGCQALLEDRLTKRFTRLDLKDAKYTAAVSADTKGTGRFYLHTSDVISGTQPVENQLFKVYKTGKIVYINGEVSENAKFFIYSVNGKQLANFNASSLVQNQFDASGLPAGVYILTINDKNQNKSVKFVIEN